jgi:lysophospholipase L1-like esterase
VSHNATKDSIVGNIEKVIAKIRRESPVTRIFLQSLLPINESTGRYSRLKGKTDMIPRINADLRKLADTYGIEYIDLFPLYKENNTNSLRLELSTDGLHLNEAGYKIWEDVLRKTF